MKFNWRSCRRSFASALATAVLVVACGGGSGGSNPGPSVPGAISLLAGSLQRAGSSDGVGIQAQFSLPQGVAQDGAGNIYVADTGNHTIRRIAPDRTVTTFAGAAGQTGSADGAGGAARFSSPQAVAVDPAGNVYVADTGNHVIRKITPAGTVTTVAGAPGQSGAVDGTGSAVRFTSPRGLAFDAAGNLFVADLSGAVRRMAPDGNVTSFAGKLGEQGFVVGDGTQARFANMLAVAVAADGTVYVAEMGLTNSYEHGRIRRFDSQARALPWGDAAQGVLNVAFPLGIAAVAGGDLLVASSGTFSPVPGIVQRHNTILRITSAGTMSVVAGADGALAEGSVDGPGAAALFNYPQAVALGGDGRILVADTGNDAVRQIDAQGVVSTLAGGAGIGRVDGPGTTARFFTTRGIAAAPDGTLYVADSGNAQVRRISASGNVSTLMMTSAAQGPSFSTLGVSVGAVALGADGTVFVGWYGDGTMVMGIASIDTAGRYGTAAYAFPQGIASTPNGLCYLIDGRVECLPPGGGVKVVATGLVSPSDIVADASGTFYVADGVGHTVRAVDPQGTVRLVAGKPGEAGYADGNADQARLTNPNALAIDDAGNLYVSDASTIRKITPQGEVRTVAGTPGQNFAAPGSLPGSIGFVRGLAWHAGMLYATVENAVLAIGPIN